jgi:hypothetical protein
MLQQSKTRSVSHEIWVYLIIHHNLSSGSTFIKFSPMEPRAILLSIVKEAVIQILAEL